MTMGGERSVFRNGYIVEGWIDSTLLLQDILVEMTGAPIHEIAWKRRPKGWMVLIKARSAHRGGLIAFQEGETLEDALTLLIYRMTHGKGLDWRPDKYNP